MAIYKVINVFFYATNSDGRTRKTVLSSSRQTGLMAYYAGRDKGHKDRNNHKSQWFSSVDCQVVEVDIGQAKGAPATSSPEMRRQIRDWLAQTRRRANAGSKLKIRFFAHGHSRQAYMGFTNDAHRKIVINSKEILTWLEACGLRHSRNDAWALVLSLISCEASQTLAPALRRELQHHSGITDCYVASSQMQLTLGSRGDIKQKIGNRTFPWTDSQAVHMAAAAVDVAVRSIKPKDLYYVSAQNCAPCGSVDLEMLYVDACCC